MERRRPQQQKRKSEFDDRLLEMRRVSRVIAGGKRFSFRATVVVGNRKGRVGIGVAKGLDFVSALEKARRHAERRSVNVNILDQRTILYEVEAKFGAARIRLKPAKKGHGLIAGGSARPVLELVGISDISAKIIGRTTNKIANARATLKALQMLPVARVKKENNV